jgi:predicted Ser/Thr protein kinase
MNAGEPFQRLFRNLLAMRNHVSATLEGHPSAYALEKPGASPARFNRTRRVVIWLVGERWIWTRERI